MKELGRREFLGAGVGVAATALAGCAETQSLPKTVSKSAVEAASTVIALATRQAAESGTNVPPASVEPRKARSTSKEKARARKIEPTPTEYALEHEPEISDIKIIKSVFANCVPYGPGEDLRWGGWIVRLDSDTHYLKSGKFTIVKSTPSGKAIGTGVVAGVNLAPGVEEFIPAFPGARSKNPEALRHRGVSNVIKGGGSKLGRVELVPSGPMKWARIDKSPEEYPWGTYFRGLFIANPRSRLFYNVARSFELGRHWYGPRLFQLGFINKGERVIEQVDVVGLYFNTNGELVDMFGNFTSKVPYGQSVLIYVPSLNLTGRCVVKKSFDELKIVPGELVYWVSFRTHTGMPVVKRWVITI